MSGARRTAICAALAAASLTIGHAAHAATGASSAFVDISLSLTDVASGWVQAAVPSHPDFDPIVSFTDMHGAAFATADGAVSSTATGFTMTADTFATASHPPGSSAFATVFINPHTITFTNGSGGDSDVFFGVSTFFNQFAVAGLNESAMTNIQFGWFFDDPLDLLERGILCGGTNQSYGNFRRVDPGKYSHSDTFLGGGLCAGVPVGESISITTFLISQAEAISVPEPASWLLTLAGLGALGLVLRRNKSRTEAAGA